MIITKDEYSLKNELDWQPLIQGQSNFTTHLLYKSSDSELRSRRSIPYILFCSLFFIAGSWLFFFVILDNPVYRHGKPLFSEEEFWSDLFTIGLSATFVAGSVSGFLCRKEVSINQFECSVCISDVYFLSEKKTTILLTDIKVLQLLRRLDKDDEGDDYWSYELNLVQHDLNRVNLLSHRGKKRIIEDAELLSNFIQKHIVSEIY